MVQNHSTGLRTGRIALVASALSLVVANATLWAQSEEDKPPPLLRGGFVQQLRSLSEGALDSLQSKSESSEASGGGETVSRGAPMGRVPRTSQSAGRATLPRSQESEDSSSNKRVAPTPPPTIPPTAQKSPGVARSTSSPARGSPAVPLSDPIPRQNLQSSQRAVPKSFVERRSAENAQPEGRLAPIESAQAVKRNASASRAAKAKSNISSMNSGLTPDIPEVHVADSLPADVKESIASMEEEAFDTDSAQHPAKPQVSRIPLPGHGSQSSSGRSPAQDTVTHDATDPRDAKSDEGRVPAKLTSTIASDESTLDGPLDSMQVPLPALPEIPSLPSSLTTPSLDETTPSLDIPAPQIESDAVGEVPGSGSPSLTELPSLPTPSLPTPSLPTPSLPTPSLPTPPTQSLPKVTRPQGSPTTLPTLPAELPRASSPTTSLVPSRGSTSMGPSSSERRTESLSNSTAASSSTERVRMETPRIAVVLEGPDDLPVGQPANYAVRVLNQDNISLSGLVLRMDVPGGVVTRTQKPSHGEIQVEQAANATLLTWTFEGLNASETAVAPIELTAQSARNFGIAMEWTIIPITGTAGLEVLAPSLEMMLEGPAEVTYGEANTYRLRIKNPGSADARNVAVTLTAESYGSSSSDIGTVKAGSEEVVDVELTFNQQGAIRIAASATAASGLNSETRIDVLVRRPGLVASVDVPNFVYHGTNTDYVIHVTNSGDAPAKNVMAKLQLPAQSKLINLPPKTRLEDGVLTWEVGELAVGAVVDLPMQLSLLREGDNELKVACTATSGITTDCAVKTSVQAVSDLKLVVIDPIAPAPLADEVAYELVLENRGSKSATGVKVIAQFSEGIEPVRGEGTNARVVPGQVLFDSIPIIEPGQTVKLKVFATAAQSGTHRFRAEVRTDDQQVRLVQEESTPFLDMVGRTAKPTAGRPVIR